MGFPAHVIVRSFVLLTRWKAPATSLVESPTQLREQFFHDLVALLDLDGDGDLDAITTEEVANPGVIWYENPTNP